MDRPVLHAFVTELVEHERVGELADALPTRARVSESALPLLLATLHERLEGELVVLLPEDADARDAAEGAAWFLGDDAVGLLPSRGVSWESGLAPPPHLVGEPARALAEGLPPAEARPEPLVLRAGLELQAAGGGPGVLPGAGGLAAGASSGVEAISASLALAGYERVDRVD